jgi:2',3'-cyclic-nucleotide 2'-phosphodiesterase (5'-nucleotidase family)
VGIIGYVTPETKQVSNSEDIIFLDEIEAVTKVGILLNIG